MDSSHVSLVTLLLRADAFGENFRCDRSMRLGVNLKALTKLLKTAGNEDQTTIRAEEEQSTLVVVIDSPSMICLNVVEVEFRGREGFFF
jgi:proliferating cell nuclear antigen